MGGEKGLTRNTLFKMRNIETRPQQCHLVCEEVTTLGKEQQGRLDSPSAVMTQRLHQLREEEDDLLGLGALHALEGVGLDLGGGGSGTRHELEALDGTRRGPGG